MKVKVVFLFFLLILSVAGCTKTGSTKTETKKDKPPLYELYINNQGNISYCRIYSIQKGKIEFDKKILELRTEKNLTILSIGKASNGRAYGTVYLNKGFYGGLNNKLVAFKDGEIQKIVTLEKKAPATS
ncbi:MAG: hypothetical protein C4589_00345 [Peptococcaceae bacterium]|nr:MAG: hypothetical protein C4589_00345 [Peptococcaceae bacterium]